MVCTVVKLHTVYQRGAPKAGNLAVMGHSPDSGWAEVKDEVFFSAG
jgi:hypothetical protein